ncbi:lysophospholipid acyltransferase family protein [Hydrogenimonas urashimensis]|uniref:lysophospholipid acyltransferase family protein n=1 Tax=Hydrogenimonas urashimensis TaxID=2740515 RepID=UPI0019166D66|nr:lysophospholipid acyltransferase family protein [Hydrogenimonas urashimensis]
MRKKWLRRLAVWLVPPIVVAVMWLLFFTNRKRWHFGGKIPETPFVVLFWHGELLMAPFIFRKAAPKSRVNVMISEHFDGEIIAKTIGAFGLATIRGSSRKGAARVLMAALRKIKEGESIGITPDGPKGPRHTVSDGAIVIAQKAHVPIVILNCLPSRYWQAGSWDRFVIPKPFGTIEYYVSEPIDIAGMEKEAARELIRKRMLEHAVE